MVSTTTDQDVIARLLESDEPSIRWKVRVNVLGEDRDSVDIRRLEREIRSSARVESLLQSIPPGERSVVPVYSKWQGSQWVFMTLADIGYPRGDTRLESAADEMVSAWLDERFFNEFEAKSKKEVYSNLHTGIPLMAGRYRTCASQQGNALHSVLALELGDEKVEKLAERLMTWQWPDGGWNCDKDPKADTSTFIHTLWSMRGVAAFARQTGNSDARAAVGRAAEVFLKRKLYKRASNGDVIRASFTKLHYPLYWHYDILGALKVLAEIGITEDERLVDSLDLLESKRLPDGGWPAEERYYKKAAGEIALGNDYVGWGGTSRSRMNEWVTADALAVLAAFGRLG